MTNFIVTWSGLIFPLLGFLGMIAWRFPVSYNKLIGPIFMLFILAAFISTVAWNWGMARTERIISGLETSVAPETSWHDRPEAEYYRIDNEEEREKGKEEHKEKYFEWQKNYYEYEGAEAAIEKAQKEIDSAQLDLFQYYWYLGVFYYALLLSNIRGWFEKMEEKLKRDESSEQDESEDGSSPNKQSQSDA